MKTIMLGAFVAVGIYLLVFVTLLAFGCVRAGVLAPIPSAHHYRRP